MNSWTGIARDVTLNRTTYLLRILNRSGRRTLLASKGPRRSPCFSLPRNQVAFALTFAPKQQKRPGNAGTLL
jgi:hypothetical protein